MPRVKMGRIFRRENKNRKATANRFYNTLWVEDENGTNERLLMFTDHEIKRAEERGRKNPEDAIKKSFLTDLLD